MKSTSSAVHSESSGEERTPHTVLSVCQGGKKPACPIGQAGGKALLSGLSYFRSVYSLVQTAAIHWFSVSCQIVCHPKER